ncbi:divergent polysaccharide deacetylase family protein, partial [Escherichia coli]|uniref:divergent polysaccharide deacetylase family protein n=1 Tax=Escherichia coli TaxID=562 RepID=UPI0005C4EDD0
AIPVAVLTATLPARAMATKVHNSGHDVLIHLPMAPLSKQPLEQNTLHPDMRRDEIEPIIRLSVNNMPYSRRHNHHLASQSPHHLNVMPKHMNTQERHTL